MKKKEKVKIKGKIHIRCEFEDGHIEYYYNNMFHREDDGPAWFDKIWAYWYKYNKLHRLNRPAIEHGNDTCWYKNGLKHRLDGPAIEWSNGSKEWWIEGLSYSKEQFDRKIKSLNEG